MGEVINYESLKPRAGRLLVSLRAVWGKSKKCTESTISVQKKKKTEVAMQIYVVQKFTLNGEFM